MGIKVSSTYSLAIGKKWLRLCSIGMDNDMRRWAIGTSIDKLNELTCKGISAPKVLAIAVHLGLGMIWGTLGSNRARVGGVLTGAAAGFGIACGIQGLTGLHPTPQSIVLVIALIALGGIIGGWASATATPAARHSAAGKKANDTDPKARP